MKTFLRTLLCLLLVEPAIGATWYLDSSNAGTHNGTSWATAWSSIAQISGISAGDTVYISGGPTGSSQNYSISSWLITGGSAGGGSITYQIGQDPTHNGNAIFVGSGELFGHAPRYVTFTGNAGDGLMHFKMSGFDEGYGGNDAASVNFYFGFTDMGTNAPGVAGRVWAFGFSNTDPPMNNVEFDHIRSYVTSCDGWLYNPCGTSGTTWDAVKFHNMEVWLPKNQTGGGAYGADGFQNGGTGYSIYSNRFVAYWTTAYNGTQHQDGIQTTYASYWKVYANTWINFGNSGVYLNASDYMTHVYVFNNITILNNGLGDFCLYGTSGEYGGQPPFSDVIIVNNLADGTPNVGLTMGFEALAPGNGVNAFSNCRLDNNVQIQNGNVSQNGAFFINGGITGGIDDNDNISLTAAQAAASYVSYTALATNNDYHLRPGASLLIAQGTNLSSYFTTDRDSNTRPAGSVAWDAGPYQFGAAGPSTNPITQTSVGSLNFGVLLTNTSLTLTFSLMNAGNGTLTGSVYGASAPFSLVGPTNYSLIQNQSATFSVKFNPSSSNTFSGTIQFVDNGGGSVSSVSLSGQANILLTSPFSALSGTLSGWSVTGSSIYQPSQVNFGDTAMATAYYWFSVPSTTNYTITAQGFFNSASANSFWLNVDQAPADPAYVWDINPPISVVTNVLVSLRGANTDTNNQFQPASFFLTAGSHVLIVYGREANAQLTQFTINGPAVGAAPSITGPTSVTNDTLSGFTMSVVATGTLPIFFQWTSNTVSLTGKTNATFSQAPAGISTSTFACISTNLYGAATNSATAKITNGTVPSFTLQPPASSSNVTNGTIVLQAQAIGTAPVSIQWAKDGTPIQGATQSMYSFTSAIATGNNYTAVAANNYGSVTSSIAAVSFTNGVTAAVVTNHPAPVTGLRILGFTLSVGASGTPPLAFQWQKNSNNIAGFTNSLMSIFPALSTDSGYYRCGVSNAFSGGFTYSSNALVAMTNGLLPVVSGPTNWVAGTNVGIDLYSQIAAGDYSYIGYAPSFRWMVLGTNITGQTSSNLVLAGVSAQTNMYSVVVGNFEGFVTNSATATITNSTQGIAPAIVNQPMGMTNEAGVCSAFLFVSATGSSPISYQWRLNGLPVAVETNQVKGLCPTSLAFTGLWDCVVTNSSGSVTSQVASVLITNFLAAPIAVSSCTAIGQNFEYALAPVSFSSAGSYSPSGLTLSYLWNFGDGTTSTQANPVHAFSSGTWAVRMSVYDGVNTPVFARDLNLLVMPFQSAGGSYFKKLMF